MTTVDQLILETERHLLAGERDELNRLLTGVDASTTTLSLRQALSGATEGSYLAIDLEIMYVWSTDGSANTVVVQRGMLGSTAATHAQDAIVTVNPMFSKWSIWTALNQEITDLSSADNGLFQEKSFDLTTQSVSHNYIVPQVNIDMQTILEIRWHEPGATNFWPKFPRTTYQIIRDLDPGTGTNYGLSIRIEELTTPGRVMTVRYAAPFTALSSTLSTDATDTGLATSMLDIPPLGAAARLMGVREAKRSFIERSVDTRRAQEVPPGSSARAASVLLQLLNSRVKNEAARLSRNWPDL